jgi:N-acylneuraminate cytidylyltransferase
VFKDYKILGLIPARGGSKSLKMKNIAQIAGKPLIEWTAIAAWESQYLDKLIVSTDHDDIAQVSRDIGIDVPFRRPAEYSEDCSDPADIICHALSELNEVYDYVVFLQPTSPLRSAADIDNAIKLCIESGSPSCISLAKPDISPYICFSLNEKGQIAKVLDTDLIYERRQDLPEAFGINGSVYVLAVDNFLKTRRFTEKNKTVAYIMPQERSFDVNTELDLRICEFLLKSRKVNVDKNYNKA